MHGKDKAGYDADCLLAIEGLVIAVCDQQSAFNRSTVFADAWPSTSTESTDRLFTFNRYLAEQMSSGHAMSWTLVLMGVFRLQVKVHERLDQMPTLESCLELIGDIREATIGFPSGQLGWLDVENAAIFPWKPIATIPPGNYLCRLTGDERPDHWDLAGPEQYPPDDSDWELHICLIKPDPRSFCV